MLVLHYILAFTIILLLPLETIAAAVQHKLHTGTLDLKETLVISLIFVLLKPLSLLAIMTFYLKNISEIFVHSRPQLQIFRKAIKQPAASALIRVKTQDM